MNGNLIFAQVFIFNSLSEFADVILSKFIDTIQVGGFLGQPG